MVGLNIPRLSVVLALLGASISCGLSPASPKTRIVLITLDTLRYDSFAGSARHPGAMPRTRAFASGGQVFEEFYTATPNTQPSHASLLTGLHPWEHGVTKNGFVLDRRHITVTERLRQAGYSTVAVVASFPLHSRFGLGQGFDEYQDDFTRSLGAKQWEGVTVRDARFYSLADHVTDQAIASLERSRAERQFFWFHYFDSHDPYGDSTDSAVRLSTIIGKSGASNGSVTLAKARVLYDRDNAFLDQELDRLCRRIAEDAERIETHVLVVSDHGESFGESGAIGHGHHVTPEQIRVPFFIRSPALAPGVRRDTSGSVDVATTILSLAGIDEVLGEGRDLTRPAPKPVAAFGMTRPVPTPYKYRLETIRNTRFYMARDGKMYAGDSTTLLQENVAPPLAEEILGNFSRFQRKLDGASGKGLLDPETRGALEALGYAQ